MVGHVGSNMKPEFCPICNAADIISHSNLFDLTIAHIDCDAFYASIEKRDNPKLEDKPVIVGGGERGVVAAACYVARKYGIHSAMPAWQAKKLCPDVVIIRPRMSLYREVGRAVREKMLSLTPMVQPISIDEAFLDLDGTQKLHQASPAQMLHHLQKEIMAEIGISVSIGLASNKSLAKMASNQKKPHGFFAISSFEAESWLAPKPISILFGIGRSSVSKLNGLGIFTCSELSKADKFTISKILGNQTEKIKELARGIDRRPVAPNRETKSLSTETTFRQDISNFTLLEAELEALTIKLSDRLKSVRLYGTKVTLKLKSSSHQTITRSLTIKSPINMTYEIFEIGRKLLQKEAGKKASYRLLGIAISGFSDRDDNQILNFPSDEYLKQKKLENAVDKLRKTMGKDMLKTGRQFTRDRRQRLKRDSFAKR